MSRSKIMFEFKKLLSQKMFICICFVIFIVATVSMLLFQPSDQFVKQPEDYAEKFVFDLERTINYAENNITDYGSSGRSYIVRYNEKIVERYSDMLEKAQIETVTGYGELIISYGDPIWIFLCSLLIGGACFLCESDCGMATIHSITKGNRHINRAKFVCLLIFSFSVSALLLLINYAVIGIKYGYNGITSSIVSIPYFEFCPYDMPVYNYILILFLWNGLLAFVLSVFVAFIGKQTESYTVTYLSGIIITLFACTDPMSCNYLFSQYHATNIVEKPVFSPIVLLICLLLLLIVGGGLLIFLSTNKEKAGFFQKIENTITTAFRRKGSIRFHIFKWNHKRHKLLFFEIKKIILHSGLIFLIFAAIGIKLFFSFTNYQHEKLSSNYLEQRYYTACIELKGKVTADKIAVVSQILDDSQSVISQSDTMRELVQNGYITSEEYAAYNRKLDEAYTNYDVYKRIEQQIVHISSLKSDNAEIIYDTGWNVLLTQKNDLLFLLTLAFLFSGIYAFEYKHGTMAIVNTTRSGIFKIHKAKYAAMVLITTILFLLFTALDIASVIEAFHLNDGDVSALSLSVISNFNLDMPLGAYLCVYLLCRLIYALIFGTISCLASYTTKKTYFALPLILILLLLGNHIL